jgi:predicted transcriptional regulator
MPEARARVSGGEGRFVGAIVGIRDLSRHTGKIVHEVTETGRPKIVTTQGRTAAIIQPIDAETMLEEVIERSAWFRKKRRRGLRELETGRTLTEEEADALRTRSPRTRGAKPARRRKAAAKTAARRKAKAPTRRKSAAKAAVRRKAKAPTRRKSAAKAAVRRKAKAPTRRKAKAKKSARRVARRR